MVGRRGGGACWGGAGRSVAVQSSVPARLSLSPFPLVSLPPSSSLILSLSLCLDRPTEAAAGELYGQVTTGPFSPQTNTGEVEASMTLWLVNPTDVFSCIGPHKSKF